MYHGPRHSAGKRQCQEALREKKAAEGESISLGTVRRRIHAAGSCPPPTPTTPPTTPPPAPRRRNHTTKPPRRPPHRCSPENALDGSVCTLGNGDLEGGRRGRSRVGAERESGTKHSKRRKDRSEADPARGGRWWEGIANAIILPSYASLNA